MIELYVSNQFEGKKLDRLLSHFHPEISRNDFFRLLRKKDIKINNIRTCENVEVHTGDQIHIYYFGQSIAVAPIYKMIYSDENLLIIDKPQGLCVQPDKNDEISLIDLVHKDYGNHVSLCHRLDRNTGGLIILGRTPSATKLVMDKIKSNEIHKNYICLCHGKMPENHKLLTAWLEKDTKNSIVYIKDFPSKHALEIKTEYTVLDYNNQENYSKLEINLHTGRTHQIRAHLAHIGHPILRDGKYGSNDITSPIPLKYQALYANKLFFKFSDKNILSYLNNTQISADYEFI